MKSPARVARKPDRVISFGSPKEAALYFDEVLPFDFALQVLGSAITRIKSDQSEDFLHAMRELTSLEVPTELDKLDTVIRSLSRTSEGLSRAYYSLLDLNLVLWGSGLTVLAGVAAGNDYDQEVRRTLEDRGIDPDDYSRWVKDHHSISPDAFFLKYRTKYDRILADAGLSSAPTWSGRFAPNIVKEAGKPSEVNFAITLRELEMIDASQLTWEQIIAFRDDPDHMRSLRDFRLYFNDNLKDEDPSLIRDRLEYAIDQQRLTARFWGFDTVKKSFAVASDKGTVALTGMAGIASALAGAPMTTAALAGAAVTIGSCVLEFGQIFVDEQKARITRPLRFLTKLEDVTKSKHNASQKKQ